jgi:hypothetical protein
VRTFNLPDKASATLVREANAAWVKANPQTVLHFSAVAYYYASNVQKALANWGDASIDPIQDQTGFFNLSEAQLKVSYSVPNAGLPVAIDIGGENIHPR